MKNWKKSHQVIDAEIEGFSKKGNGLAHYRQENGNLCVVEVPFALPGDKVKAELLSKKGGCFRSALKQVVVPSSSRIVARCLHFGSCGGCRWQQQPYEEQLKSKEAAIRRSFASYFLADELFRPIVPCDPPWHYRNKMEFSFSNDSAGNHFLGLVIDDSKGKVLNLTECHLVSNWFIPLLQQTRNWWKESRLQAYHPYRNSGSLRTLTMREGQRSGDRMAILTVSGNPDYALKQEELDSFVRMFLAVMCSYPTQGRLSLFLRIQQTHKGKPTNFYEMQLFGEESIREELYIAGSSYSFHISPMAFFQPNTRQAEKLYSLALELIDGEKKSLIYDLYCGTGTLGICFAKAAQEVIGIELSPEAILDARENAKMNRVDNITFICGDVKAILAQKARQQPSLRPSLVVVDPPRAGLGQAAIEQILALKPPSLLYISCNPASQAEDMAPFLLQGYQIAALQPVDQFPHTPHVENIAFLKLLNK